MEGWRQVADEKKNFLGWRLGGSCLPVVDDAAKGNSDWERFQKGFHDGGDPGQMPSALVRHH